MNPDTPTAPWVFFTNHAVTLLVIARQPDLRLLDLARQVGVTERTTQSIITDLAQAGYIHRERNGRRNTYTIDPAKPLRHPTLDRYPVARLLAIVNHDG